MDAQGSKGVEGVAWRSPSAELITDYEPQTGTRSEGTGNTAQSPCTKRSAVSFKFSEIHIYGNKLKLKDDNSFRLMFENTNGVPPNMDYYPTSWKHERLRRMHTRFQADVLNIVETKINPSLAPHTFLMEKKMLQVKECSSVVSNISNELLGMI